MLSRFKDSNMYNYALQNSDITPVVDLETRRHWLLAVIAIQFAVLFAPTMLWLWNRWTMAVWYNAHGVLIMLVVMYLVRGELYKLRRLTRSSNPVGFAFLIPALAIHTLDAGINTQLLSAVALFLSLPGLSLLLLGTERTKSILFPLCVMFLTLPIPLVFTESIHLALRYLVTDSVAWLLPVFGVPVFVNGTLLEIPNGSLQVADSCSGFSTLYATVTVAILTSYFCSNNRRRVIILIIAAPLAVAVNIIRVLLLALLVQWFGLDVLKTSAHEISGLLTFVVALPIIFWLGRNSEVLEDKK